MSENSPRVTVVVPIYNVEKWIEGCVQSVLASPLDLELIVVNDSSTDRSAELAKAVISDDPRGRVIDNQRQKGGDGARNTGLLAATAPFIIFLDGDDEFADGGLEILVTSIESDHRVSAICGSFNSRDEDGSPVIGGWETEQQTAVVGSPELARAPDFARAQLAPPPGAIIMQRDIVCDVGGWDEGVELAGLATDYELLARMATAAPIALRREVVCHYCIRPTSLSRRPDHPRKYFRARVLAIKRAPHHVRTALAVATATRSWRLARERVTNWRQPRHIVRGLGNATQAFLFLAACIGGRTSRVTTLYDE